MTIPPHDVPLPPITGRTYLQPSSQYFYYGLDNVVTELLAKDQLWSQRGKHRMPDRFTEGGSSMYHGKPRVRRAQVTLVI